jgi:hypothetical protein
MPRNIKKEATQMQSKEFQKIYLVIPVLAIVLALAACYFANPEKGLNETSPCICQLKIQSKVH